MYRYYFVTTPNREQATRESSPIFFFFLVLYFYICDLNFSYLLSTVYNKSKWRLPFIYFLSGWEFSSPLLVILFVYVLPLFPETTNRFTTLLSMMSVVLFDYFVWFGGEIRGSESSHPYYPNKTKILNHFIISNHLNISPNFLQENFNTIEIGPSSRIWCQQQ